ncbi:hypothetical protein BH09PSE1_BH09PSE1_10470 [soil metagenome]
MAPTAMTTSDRLLNLLGLFSTAKTAWTVEEAALELGLSVSNTYRYFRSLVAAGFIVQAGAKEYVLGPAVIQLDRQMRLNDPLINAARPLMQDLVSHAPTGCVAILCRAFKGQVICIHEELIQRPQLSMSYERGLPMPLWRGAASKAILAHFQLRKIKVLRDEHAEEFRTFGLGGTWTETKAALRDLRSLPVIHTERELGTPTSGLAAPLFDGDQIIGSLGLVVPIESADRATVTTLSEAVAAAGGRINLELRSGGAGASPS